jgi:methyl-accepting chemotaxis protein
MAITFDTVFKIGAVFTGAAAMNQAQAAVTNLEKKGLLANLSLKKMVVTLGGLAAGYLTVDKLTGFINSSVDAARKAKAAYQGLSDSLGRVPQLQRLGTKVIKEQTDYLDNLAKAMEKVGGLASENLAGAFSHLVDIGFSPAKIKDMSGAFEDMVVRVKGIKATFDDATQVADQFGNAVKQGGEQGFQTLVQFGILTQDQHDRFVSLNTAGQRYNYTLQEMKKHTGDTAEAMKSAEGVQVKLNNAWKNVKVALGTPFMLVQDKAAEAMGKIQEKLVAGADKIATAFTPTLNKITDRFTAWISKFIDNIDKYSPQIDKFGDVILGAFDWIAKHGQETAVAIGAIGSAFGTLATVGMVASNITKVTTAVQGLSGAFKVISAMNFGGIFAVMSNPITLVIAGIALLAFGIYELIKHWNDVKWAAGIAWDWIVKKWGEAGAWLTEHVGKPTQQVVAASVGLWNDLSKAVQDGWNAVVKAWDQIKQIKIGDIWEAFKKANLGIVEWIDKNIVLPIIKAFTDLPGKIGHALLNLGKILAKPFEEAAAKLKSIPFIGQILGMIQGSLGFGGGTNVPAPNTEQVKAAMNAHEKMTDEQKKSANQINDTTKTLAKFDEQVDKTTGNDLVHFNAALDLATANMHRLNQSTAVLTASNNTMLQGMGGMGGAVGGAGVGGGGGFNLGSGYTGGGGGPYGFGGGSTSVVGSYSGGMKMTTYGYEKPGAKDYDWNSAHGIGAFSQHLIPGYSVALSTSAQKALGVRPGQVFNYGGRTYKFDDRSPQPFPNIDVYTRKAGFGGFFGNRTLATIAERVPEMVLPLERTSRSRSLLGAAASRITGAGGGGGIGGSPIHLNMSAPITIHGVEAGKEGEVARQVERALRDPIAHLLDQLKKAKQHEGRLAYA